MPETIGLTLLTMPGTMRLWRHTPAVETDHVAAIKPVGEDPMYHRHIDSTHKLTPIDIALPPYKAARLVLLFRKLYTEERDTRMFDCLSAMDFICGSAGELNDYHVYTSVGPLPPDDLVPYEPYIITNDGESMPTHGMLTTDHLHAVHVAGPNSVLTYSPATSIVKAWPGDIMRVTAFHPQTTTQYAERAA